MADDVADLWGEIINWLRRNAPVDAGRLRPPASDSLVSEVQATVGSLPDDLRRWWRQADGALPVAGVHLIPWGFTPMSCRDALKDREMRVGIWAEDAIEDDDLDDDGDDEDVGVDEEYGFLPHYLPIGDDHCGNCMYVDLRDGSIKFHDHEDGFAGDFYWRGITEMLTEIRDALIDNKPGLLGKALRTAATPEAPYVYRATVTAGRELEWVPERLGSSG